MPREELLEFLRHLLDPAAYEKAQNMVRMMTDTSTSDDLDDAGQPRPAMDAKHRFAMDSSDAFIRMRDLEEARRTVAPVVGEIRGANSAADVFRSALSEMGMDAGSLHPSALPAMFETVRRNRAQSASGGTYNRPMDSRATASFNARHPEIARVRVLG